MTVRALVAVLILVGQVPLRVCTCGAVHLHVAKPAAPSSSNNPDDRPTASDPLPGHHHDHDCQAVNPKASFKCAVPTADEPDPIGGFFSVAWIAHHDRVPVHPDLTSGTPFRPPDTPSVPLFIAYLTLRN
jgi:hypothetical protein